MSNEDIDKIIQLSSAEELSVKEKAVKDAIELYFAIEDPEELIQCLKISGCYPSLNKVAGN